MEDFLFLNTRLEKGSLEKDKYGFLERENGVYYFKLKCKDWAGQTVEKYNVIDAVKLIMMAYLYKNTCYP